MKYFRMSYEEVVFKRSYLNILLLNRSIPSYKSFTDEDYKTTPKNKRNENYRVDNTKFKNESELFMSLM